MPYSQSIHTYWWCCFLCIICYPHFCHDTISPAYLMLFKHTLPLFYYAAAIYHAFYAIRTLHFLALPQKAASIRRRSPPSTADIAYALPYIIYFRWFTAIYFLSSYLIVVGLLILKILCWWYLLLRRRQAIIFWYMRIIDTYMKLLMGLLSPIIFFALGWHDAILYWWRRAAFTRRDIITLWPGIDFRHVSLKAHFSTDIIEIMLEGWSTYAFLDINTHILYFHIFHTILTASRYISVTAYFWLPAYIALHTAADTPPLPNMYRHYEY